MTPTEKDMQALRLARATIQREIEAGSDLLASTPIGVVVNALTLILATLRARAPEVIAARVMPEITTAVEGLSGALNAALPVMLFPPSSTRRN